MISRVGELGTSDVHRWKKLKHLTDSTRDCLTRWPVLADRALHEIERLWTSDFARFPEKRKLSIYESTSWWNSLPTMQRTIATNVAKAYCKEQMENKADA